MKLVVEFTDLPYALEHMNYSNELIIERRVVLIPLTPEQEALLAPTTCGTRYNRETGKHDQMYETRRIVCCQDDDAERGPTQATK